jgi:hypothetical protein
MQLEHHGNITVGAVVAKEMKLSEAIIDNILEVIS